MNGKHGKESNNIMKVAFCTKIGEPEWTEELLTEVEDRIPAATKWAEERGYNVRVAEIDLSVAPDFTKTIN
jgi:hypothetical protein